MTTQQQSNTNKKILGIVKQVLSGDSLVIRAPKGSPPPERTIILAGITVPKLARRSPDNSDDPQNKDQPWAWEAREFLRKKLIGEKVWFTTLEKQPNPVENSDRKLKELGAVYYGADEESAVNVAHLLVAEGLAFVRDGKKDAEGEKLLELQEAAKTANKGRWSGNDSEHVRNIKWTIQDMKAFKEKRDRKPIKAIIEHVRDGSTVRAFLLPDFYYVTVMMCGIRCNGFKQDEKGRRDESAETPFAKEAQFLVEARLLQRDVEIILESTNNTNFVGTILYPKGNIAEALLKEGLAKCVDWSMSFLTSDNLEERYRQAERAAKQAKLRLWQDYQPTAPQPGREKEFTGTVIEVFNGDALNVKLPNGNVKKIFLSSLRPPRPDDDKKGPLVQRPKGFRPLYDIPGMFEAREFLRKKLIGKKVQVVVDYIQVARENLPEKTCCTVTVGSVNIAEALISKGLATVVNYRADDDQRSSQYQSLANAQVKAAKSLSGIHSKKQTPLRVIEIDSVKSKQFLQSFQRQQSIDAIVEFVSTGSRFRLYVPKENCLCTFLLAGISCPRSARPATLIGPATQADPFGEEALAFVKERCLQHEVSIRVDSADRAGNFIGFLFINNVNLSVALVEEGFASVLPSADRSEFYKQLKNAEDSAKLKKLRRWKEFVEEKEEQQRIEEEHANPERKINYEEVIVTEITPEGTFFVQNIQQGPKVEALYSKFRQEFQVNPPVVGAYGPKRGDIAAAKFSADGEWYRARVERVYGSTATVLYIDYGNREDVNVSSLASLPAAYTSDRPFATEYSLACVNFPKDPEFKAMAIKFLSEDTSAGKMLLNVEYKVPGSPPFVTLYTEAKEDVAKNLVTDGLLLVDNRRESRLQSLIAEYKKAQDTAKKNHENIWEYGDITEDDAKEFGHSR